MPFLSVIVPVYKAERSLEELWERLKASLEEITGDFEVVMVEDCSGDGSWEVIRSLARQDDRIRGIQLSRNFGQHAATICGLSKARGEWMITLDDDLEHRPEDIPALYMKALQGYDLVYGVYDGRSHSVWRNMTSAIARLLFKMAIPSLNHEYTSFRIMNAKTAEPLPAFDSPFPFIDGYLSWITNNYATIPVEHGRRKHSASNYTVGKLFKHTMNIFVTFSDLPLRMATWIGMISFLIGFCWISFILLSKMLGGMTVSGYASLMGGIILFGGAQMLSLGIMGEYLGRVNFKTSRKPLFIVAKETPVRENALLFGEPAGQERVVHETS